MARDSNTRNGKPSADGFDLVVDNRKARHDFFIEETLEAGLALTGTEVKSLRAHRANLRDSYARIKNGEAFLESVHIGAYAPAGQFSHKETRARKLLMHRREIDRLWGRVREKGYSIVPLKIYFKRWPRQGRARTRQGQALVRQARRDRAQGVGSRNRARTERPQPLDSPVLVASWRNSAARLWKPATLADNSAGVVPTFPSTLATVS